MVLGEYHPGSRPDSRLGLAWPVVTHGGWVGGFPVGGSPKPGCPKTRGKKKEKERKRVLCV
jgi:hypothetical protein